MFVLGTPSTSASRTGIKQALRNYALKEQRGGSSEEGKKVRMSTNGLWEGLQKDSRRDRSGKAWSGGLQRSGGIKDMGETRRKWTDSICALGSTGTLGVIPAALVLSPRGVCQVHCPQQRPGGWGAEDPGAETGLWPLLSLTPGKT